MSSPITSSNYSSVALRTESPAFHPTNSLELTNALHTLVRVGKHLDSFKRQMFYGSPQGISEDRPIKLSLEQIRVLHGILGLATETAELAEVFMESLNDQTKMNITLIKEELGDIQWYVALISDASALLMNDVLATNIAKLSCRYPERFDAQRAVQRDLDAEHSILTGGSSNA